MPDELIIAWTVWGIVAFLILAPSLVLLAEVIDARSKEASRHD